jgi:hypothetical protein
MIYLSGTTSDAIEPALIAAGVGLVVQPGNGYASRVGRFAHWAAENACYAGHWHEGPWLDWLAQFDPVAHPPLFAVAPDVYPDAAASMERGLRYCELIRSMGFPVAVLAQDGAEELDWPAVFDRFDVLFIGGRYLPGTPWREWKVSEAAAGLIRRARNAGLWVHMGRVNTWSRLRWAAVAGCLSADGTGLAYGPDLNTPQLGRWLAELDYQPTLWRYEMPSHPTHRSAVA